MYKYPFVGVFLPFVIAIVGFGLLTSSIWKSYEERRQSEDLVVKLAEERKRNTTLNDALREVLAGRGEPVPPLDDGKGDLSEIVVVPGPSAAQANKAGAPRPTAAAESPYSAGNVAKHAGAGDCWMILNGKVYDVSYFLDAHPGGKESMLPHCGKDATAAYTTKGKTPARTHSAQANSMLPTYYLADVVTTKSASPKNTNPTGIQSPAPPTKAPTVTSPPPSPPPSATPIAPTPAPQPAPTQNPPPPNTASTIYTTADVATHSALTNCWVIIGGKIYDVTGYIVAHPGGTNAIASRCGSDATTAFTQNGSGGHAHSASAYALLPSYYVGDVGAAAASSQPSPTPTPAPGVGPATHSMNIGHNGPFPSATLTINAGDSVQFVFASPGDDEITVTFVPSNIPSVKLDHETTTATRIFSIAGTWVLKKTGGYEMTVIVQ